MATDVQGSNSFPNSIRIPDVGEKNWGQDLNGSLVGLTNRTKWLENRLSNSTIEVTDVAISASNLIYEPTTPSDWDVVPSTVSDALDNLAGEESWNVIETVTVTGASSNIDISIPSGYSKIEFHLVDITSSSDGAGFYIRVSTDGGSTFQSGTSDYDFGSLWFRYDTSGNRNGRGNKIDLTNSKGIGNGVGESLSGKITITNPYSTNYKLLQLKSTWIDEDGKMNDQSGGGSYIGTNVAIDYIRFYLSSGNVSGTVKVMGLK